MNNFVAHNPTQLHFGKDILNKLGITAATYGKKALLMYGKGSVLKNGSYNATVEQLKSQNIEIIEYNGIKPNPIDTAVDEAVMLGKEAGVDMVVAVGGGSVIDSAKVASICIADDVEAWKVMSLRHRPRNAKPLIAILTLAATGTEMNAAAVLQNHETNKKIGLRNPLMYPAHSFLDPTYTLSVPENYTAYGITDLVAHSLEAWFGEGHAPLSDRIVVSIIQEAMEIGPALLDDLQNYEYRERIMWAATVALNDTTMHGRTSGDWGTHSLGHILSYLYDTAHGATLSVLFPAWMRQVGKTAPERVIELGRVLFGSDSVEGSAGSFEKLFQSLRSPIKAQEAGISEDKKAEILELWNKNNAGGMHFKLKDQDRSEILNMIF